MIQVATVARMGGGPDAGGVGVGMVSAGPDEGGAIEAMETITSCAPRHAHLVSGTQPLSP